MKKLIPCLLLLALLLSACTITPFDPDGSTGNKGNDKNNKQEDVVEEEELKVKLIESLELLTEKERRVIELYYYEELTLKEISSILEVSESRVSQLHTRALQKMKTKMGNYLGIFTAN